MRDGTGMTEFAKKFPDRFFDVGIAEQHALTMAAGMARSGLKPVISIYSSFYQRGYDQVIHDICMQELPVVMCVDRAGIVGNDGETHQGIYDLAFFNLVPNINIMAPKDFEELGQMLEFAVNLNKPVVIRYPRGGESKTKFTQHEKIELGKCERIVENTAKKVEETEKDEGKCVTIIAIGNMVARAVEVAKVLEERGVVAEIINSRFLKPLDKEGILSSVRKTKNCITIEDGVITGGLGTAIKELIVDEELRDVKIKSFAYPDKFIEHGSVAELEKKYGMDAETIATKGT